MKLLHAGFSGLAPGLAARPYRGDDGFTEFGVAGQAIAAEARLLAAPVSFEMASSTQAEGIEDRTTMAPLARPSIAPPGPKRTFWTALVSETQTHTASLSLAASAGVAAVLAPSTSRGVRFQTVTSWPALTRLAAMGRPMIPRPKKATRMLGIKRVKGDGVKWEAASHQESAKFGFHRKYAKIAKEIGKI